MFASNFGYVEIVDKLLSCPNIDVKCEDILI